MGELMDKLQDLQDKVDAIGFKGQNEYDLHLREEIADYISALFPLLGKEVEIKKTGRQTCPNCKQGTIHIVNNFCPSCGSKIKWID